MSASTDAGTVTIAEGWEIPREITETFEDHGGVDVTLTAVYSAESGRYEVAELTVSRRPGGPEVTGEALRQVPVKGVLRTVTTRHVLDGQPPGPVPPVPASGPTTETLTWVARIYTLAVLLGDAPTQRVAEAMGVPRATAGRWVTRARDRGLLTVTDPRGTARG